METGKFFQIPPSVGTKTVGEEALVENNPIPFEKKVCVLKETTAAPCKTKKKTSTKEEVLAGIAELRAKYAPFMENHAPVVPSMRQRIELKEFVMDGEKTVQLPYYDGPIGDHTQNLETEFEMAEFGDKEVYICFQRADYIAIVYVNGVCVGSHEGFFAPFEFNITSAVKVGKNHVKVVLKNDFIYMGYGAGGVQDSVPTEGDKLYARHGLGYDDPATGWHHCPPGMGIYGEVHVETRSAVAITDLFVRPDPENGIAELWAEVDNIHHISKEITLDISLYGRNFKETVFEHEIYEPKVHDKKMTAAYGKNVYKLPIKIPNIKLWNTDTPYLYQINVAVSYQGEVTDTATASFGMRSFSQDTESEMKGMFYLNGQATRLRGTNTMGFEQQDVLRGEYDQLIDDILMTKLANCNFWRLTQRPVQDEVYQYCDMLGLMTQTDFPLFGVMRRTKFAEGVRQAEEMIRLVRKHPCNVVITYANEPYFNENYVIHDRYSRAQPHRHMVRKELWNFFIACDLILKHNHPDVVIKHVDGDYAPPDLSGQNCMTDIHCYSLWYFAHGIGFNKLYKGYWQNTLPGWYYGCGEYGAEALDYPDVIRKYYLDEWKKEPFDPNNIMACQTGRMHHYLYDTPDSMEEWSYESLRHQGQTMQLMTEAFRRDPRMVSTGSFHIIDAWPAGWMKAMVDFQRTPKPAYYALKDAYEPIMVSVRTDRLTCYVGETVSVEAYICNDTQEVGGEGWELVFEVYDGEKMVLRNAQEVSFEANMPKYITNAEFTAFPVEDRKKLTVKAILTKDGEAVHYNTIPVEIFARRPEVAKNDDVVLITDLEVGEHEIAGETVKVEKEWADWADMVRLFVSRKTGHPAVAEFKPWDFSMWYDKEQDMFGNIAPKKFTAEGFTPIIIGDGTKKKTMVVGVKEYEGKKYVICLLKLLTENPVAQRFLDNLKQL